MFMTVISYWASENMLSVRAAGMMKDTNIPLIHQFYLEYPLNYAVCRTVIFIKERDATENGTARRLSSSSENATLWSERAH